jgi:hypothetical protein
MLLFESGLERLPPEFSQVRMFLDRANLQPFDQLSGF